MLFVVFVVPSLLALGLCTSAAGIAKQRHDLVDVLWLSYKDARGKGGILERF
jgi:hypothetical protein